MTTNIFINQSDSGLRDLTAWNFLCIPPHLALLFYLSFSPSVASSWVAPGVDSICLNHHISLIIGSTWHIRSQPKSLPLTPWPRFLTHPLSSSLLSTSTSADASTASTCQSNARQILPLQRKHCQAFTISHGSVFVASVSQISPRIPEVIKWKQSVYCSKTTTTIDVHVSFYHMCFFPSFSGKKTKKTDPWLFLCSFNEFLGLKDGLPGLTIQQSSGCLVPGPTCHYPLHPVLHPLLVAANHPHLVVHLLII